MIFKNFDRTGPDSIFSDQGWTRTEKFHTPLISGLYLDQRWDRIRITGVDSGRILRFIFGPGSVVKNL